MSVNRLDFTESLVKKTGSLIRQMMNKDLDVTTKSNRTDFVTNVDKSAEQFLVEGLCNEYGPQDFLTEEKTVSRCESDDLWIIDPIDGTLNFIYQGRNFAISIAYYCKGQPVFGIIYDVMRDEMVVGIYGQGLFVNGVKQGFIQREIQVQDSLISVDHQTIEKHLKTGIIHDFVAQRYVGSAAIEICDVALNRIQLYVACQLKAWDIAAGLIILHESQAVTNQIGNRVFSEDNIPFIAASNQSLVNYIQEASDGIF